MLASLAAIDLRDLGERARRVDGGDRDARRKALACRLVDVPAHVDPALGLVVEGLQRRRLDRIDGDARPGCMMPTMRSPGTAPSGAKRTGRSPRTPRIGTAPSPVGSALSLRAARPGIWNIMPAALRIFEPALLARLGRRRRDALVLVVGDRRRCSTSVEASSPRPTAASTSSTSLRASRCSTGFRLSLREGLAGALEGALEDARAEARNIACGWRSWWRGGWRRAPCR